MKQPVNCIKVSCFLTIPFPIFLEIVNDKGEGDPQIWAPKVTLFGFPKGRIKNKTIFPIGIARPSTSRSRFLLKLGFARCTGENSHF